jgi:hypothetical protein
VVGGGTIADVLGSEPPPGSPIQGRRAYVGGASVHGAVFQARFSIVKLESVLKARE